MWYGHLGNFTSKPQPLFNPLLLSLSLIPICFLFSLSTDLRPKIKIPFLIPNEISLCVGIG